MGKQLDRAADLIDRRVRTSDGREGVVHRAMPKAGGMIECTIQHDDARWSLAFAARWDAAPDLPFITEIISSPST